MRLLWIATKAPWPARDGGRVLMTNTLRALAAHDHEVVLVAPFDPRRESREEVASHLREICEPHLVAAAPRRMPLALLRSRVDGVPTCISRHASTAMQQAVDGLLAREPFDVVQAEQLQALWQCAPALRRAVPVVLRAQNVESELWSALLSSRPALRLVARREVRRLARYEGRAVGTVAATIALTGRDADRLRTLSADHGVVLHVPAPFPERLPPSLNRLRGAPAVIVLGGGWLPNRDGAAWFMSRIWPDVRARCPDAVLHVFGTRPRPGLATGIEFHESPAESDAAFPTGSILAVPLRIASGVRMKILEAWARGVPVVATPEAAAGLDSTEGDALLLARDAREFSAGIDRLHRDPELARATIEAGRAILKTHHDPDGIAHRLARVYADVAGHVG